MGIPHFKEKQVNPTMWPEAQSI